MVKAAVMPTALIETATGELVLRICGSSRDGQIVRLKSPKCTIGSGARCSLRLRGPGIRPIHCLILRGIVGTVIRRWSPDTRLNGRAFDDAPLMPGDRLTVGPVELEVVDSGRSPDVEAAELEQQRGQWQAERAEAEQQLSRRTEELDARSAELENRRAALDEERRGWETQQAESESQSTEQFDARRAELDALQAELEQQREQWQAERAEAEQQLGRRTEELDGRNAELESRRAALDEERHGWETQRAEGESQSIEQIDAQRTELDAQREELEQQRQQWQAEHSEAEQQLGRRTEELDARSAELQSRRTALDEERRDWETQRAETEEQAGQRDRHATIESEQIDRAADSQPADQGDSEQPSEEAPVDLEAVLRRMGNMGVLRGDEPQESSPAEPVADVMAPQPEAASLPAADEEEESIDDYMAQLMKRVQTAAQGAKKTENRPQRRQSESPSEAPAEQPPSVPPAVQRRREPVEMAPRAAAPERVTDLSAMRELANLSAQTAIDRHTRRTAILTNRSKLLVATVGAVTGGLLLWMWWTIVPSRLVLYAVSTGFAVAGLWGLQYLLLTGRRIVGSPGRERKTQGQEERSPDHQAGPVLEDDAGNR